MGHVLPTLFWRRQPSPNIGRRARTGSFRLDQSQLSVELFDLNKHRGTVCNLVPLLPFDPLLSPVVVYFSSLYSLPLILPFNFPLFFILPLCYSVGPRANRCVPSNDSGTLYILNSCHYN